MSGYVFCLCWWIVLVWMLWLCSSALVCICLFSGNYVVCMDR